MVSNVLLFLTKIVIFLSIEHVEVFMSLFALKCYIYFPSISVGSCRLDHFLLPHGNLHEGDPSSLVLADNAVRLKTRQEASSL